MAIESEAISTAYQGYLNIVASQLGISIETIALIITIIGIWALVWKGLALWKSSQKKQIYWFIALLVVNSMGILEILYIFIFSKLGKKSAKIEEKPVKKDKKK